MAQAIVLNFYNEKNKIVEKYEPYGWDIDLLLDNYSFTKIVDYDIDYSLFVTPEELVPLLDIQMRTSFVSTTSMGRSNIHKIKNILTNNPDYTKIELYIYEWESGLE